ncbi:hypothetical protein FJR11_22420 [Anabaena sp. UHCC 0187]|uniref:plasmid replication protein, CyRepA1 family n=1 Tax=Anabaena sp. UHCC 0187 TaxID=2590018 RepID=UPI001444BDB6|nr:plasmid replication protein, CyRepA1 family [Anabaena sp. UHCC 0187]MTJ15266.1 hypothetical protein [Anabaena sp. UHCC 0187]
MSKGYYSLKPCPVCDSASGKCRGKEDSGKEYILCMTFADVRKGQIENGYKCIKSSDNGYQHNSATFVLDNSQEWTEQQREEWITLNQKRKADAELEKKAKREKSLTADQRHKEYSKILDSLKLDITTVSDLKKRGFTENEINDCGFVSVEAWHKLPFAVDPQLPGISAKNSLIASGDGYLCPLRNYDGQVVALQLRLHYPDDSGRYRWVSSERQTLALNVGDSLENPLGVFKPENPIGIAIVEGTGAKPYLASKRLNNIVIGAAGGQFAGSPKLLEEYLSRASEDVGTKKVTIFPDAGDILNKSVMTRWEQVTKLIISFGYEVQLAWWGQVSKDDGDVDELTDFSQIEFISVDEFSNLIKSSKPAQKKESKTDDWEQKRAKTATYNLTRKADLPVESGYLPSLKLSDIPSPLLGIKGNCGAGKSVFISNILKEWNENVIQVAHLNNLLSNTAPKFDLMHHRELIDDLGLSVAAHSNLAITDISMAAKLEIPAWLGNNRFILVLDEIEQVLKSIQTNKNLRGNSLRLKARVKLEWMVKNAAYVICSDRDLCDETIEYVEQIRGEKFYLIHHTGKKGLSRMPVKMVVNKDKTKVLQSLYSDTQKGLKVLIGCENRSDLTAIELELQKMGTIDKAMLFVHGENSNEKEIKDIIADIDKQYFNYPIFGYTSTLGTGISLDTQHFDKAYYFVSGDVLQASEIIQLMSRYRPDVNTTIWCNAITRKLEINPENLLTDIQENLKETKGLINAIDKFDYFVKEGIFVNPSGEIPKEDIPWIKHKLSIIARLNASRANPSKSLYDELIKDGCTVILDDSEVENNSLDAVHKANKEEIKLIQDEAVAKSEVMNDEQYKNARMNPGSLNKEEQAQFKKTRLVHELGVHETEVNNSLVELERTKGVVSGAKALKIVLGDKDTALAYDLRDKESNPDPFDQKFHAVSWQYFHDLGFDKFLAEIKEDFNYSKDSELVIKIADKARKSASKFKRVIGIDISKKKSDCAIVGHLLDKLCILREKPEKGKNKARIYKINMQHHELLINAVSHINKQEKTLTLERLINNKIDQTMVSECAEVIRLAFDVADNPTDEYELIMTVGEDKPKLVKKLIFSRLTEEEQDRVRQTEKAAKEMISV